MTVTSKNLVHRHLLKGVLLSGMSVLCASPAGAQDSGQEEAALPIAVQMYTLRHLGSLDEQFAAVEQAGVEAVELVGDQDVSAEEMTTLLDKHGLEVISSHVQLDKLRSDLDEVVAFHKAIGNDTIVIPYLEEEARPTDKAGWQALGEEIGELADDLAQQDLHLAYHNHDFEMQSYDGETALEILLDAAGPEVMAEVDVAWVARAGLDPADYLANFEDRLFAIHAKDNAPEGTAEDEKGFAALDQGVLDWAAILPAAEAEGNPWYIIEHDQPADAQAVIEQGASFLKSTLVDVVKR
uniref:sugar phosphate isomerase/epimerase family protein n=1 Tax=Halomonas sp. TaxID=1486246 RepID=UPI00261F2457|nr:sugar phosphate isomerase/epimerase [Halomonas sp.]